MILNLIYQILKMNPFQLSGMEEKLIKNYTVNI